MTVEPPGEKITFKNENTKSKAMQIAKISQKIL